MSIEQTLYSALTGDATVGALISTRCYPVGAVPTKVTYPFVSYTRISTERYNTIGTTGVGYISNIQAATMQINCVAETYTGAKALASAVYNVHATRGDMFLNELDLYNDDSAFVGAHMVVLEFRMWE